MHDVYLFQKLHPVENDLLSALENGESISACHQTLSTIPDLLRTASQTGAVGQETLLLALSVASRIEVIASYILDLRQGAESCTTSFQSDCDVMIRQLAAIDINAQLNTLHPNSEKRPASDSRSGTMGVENSSTPFFVSAHRWLMDNLDNPYPTAKIKARMATTSSCSVSSINSWFVNARRRIGWTTLCRERFSNCRADMLDAAYRALVKEDPQRVLPPDLRHSFVAMKVAAGGLYPSTFSRSTLTRDINTAVSDMPEHKNSSPRKPILQGKAKVIRDSYPSPDRSTTSSPLSASDDSITDENKEDVLPPTMAGSKRRRSITELTEPVAQLPAPARPMKRLRVSPSSMMYLPSPSSSVDGVDLPTDRRSRDPSPARSIQAEANQVQPLHKRRPSDTGSLGSADVSNQLPPFNTQVLSDTAFTGILCPSSTSTTTPHAYDVSDPLPHVSTKVGHSVDDWFATNFDTLFSIPPPVEAVVPDSSASWEVELFKDYGIPGNSKFAPEFFPTGVQTDLSDFESLLKSIGSDICGTQSECVPPTDATSLDLPEMFQTNIDWTSLFNDSAICQSNSHSTFTQYLSDTQPLPKIDLSALQLPQVIPPINSRRDSTLKQTKLDQLHAMQKAVRQMEQELQSEGVII